MKRRDFLKKAGVVAASASLSPLMFANAQTSRFRFGMVTSWPTSLDTIFGGATNTANFLREITDGDVDVTVYPAGAEVGGLEVYDAVSSGAFEMGHTASYYYIGKDPAHGFFTSVPFGMNAQQMNAWFYNGGGLELWNELNAGDDLIAFPAGNTGVQMGGWFRREINSPADLQGLTMRIP
jgi:TRAP-type mannitol/chloroaromatic compound transport system substrate-binding protein